MSNSQESVLVYCLQVPIKEAETVKHDLINSGTFLKNFRLLKERNFIYLPINYSEDASYPWPVEQKLLTPLQNKLDYHKALRAILPSVLHEFIPSSFDRVGSIILIKLQPELESYKQVIGTELLKQFNVQAVFNKIGDVDTKYRTVTWECIAGNQDPVTIHKMNNLRFKVDVSKVYFNSRLSNEYSRIASLCTDGDKVIDMFAGVGPFTILVASQKDVEIFALDINPAAIHYLNENIVLNRKFLIGKITTSCGDSKELLKTLPKANKIIMNLPGSAIDFLLPALQHLESNGTIFLHQFVHLTKEEKKLELDKPLAELTTLINQLSYQNDLEQTTYTITGNKLRAVSPGKIHVVWDITKYSR